jgi:hypothetical protein
MKEKRTEPIKPSTLKIDPQPGNVIVEMLTIKSKIEKDLIKKSPDLIVDKEQVKARMEQVIKSTGNVTTVWEEHPDQAIIVVIPYDLALERDLRVGDRIAIHRTEYTGRLIVYKKKKYYSIMPQEILFRYLTDES